MKRLLFILLLFPCWIYAQDTQILSTRDISGTARYVGMAGAMTAVGGDASAVWDNPAGLGAYQSFEAQLTLDVQHDKVRWRSGGNWCDGRTKFIPSTVSTAFLVGESANFEHRMLIGYRRLKDYARSSTTSMYVDDLNDDISAIDCEENGYVNDYAFTYAFRYRDLFSIGLSLDAINYQYSKSVGLYFDYDPKTTFYPNRYDKYYSSIILNGVGVQGKIGVLANPTPWMKFGFSFSTPSGGSLKGSDYCSLEAVADGYVIDTLSADYGTAYLRSRSFSMPLNTSAGIAFRLRDMATFSLQYDYAHHKQMDDIHGLKFGFELNPIKSLSINLGYAYESTFKSLCAAPSYSSVIPMNELRGDIYNRVYEGDRAVGSLRSDKDIHYVKGSHYLGAGIGYKGTFFQFHVAYQYRRQNVDLFYSQFFDEENGVQTYAADKDGLHFLNDLRGDTHRVVVTIGFLSPKRSKSATKTSTTTTTRTSTTTTTTTKSQKKQPYFTQPNENSVTLHI